MTKREQFQTVINQLENQIKWFKKEHPFDSEYYQSGDGFQKNTNPFRKLTQEECENILVRVKMGMQLLKKYKQSNYLNKLRLFKYKTLYKQLKEK